MQMLCLKNADTSRFKRWGLWLAACVLSQAQIGFAADSTLPDSAFEALQKQAQQWAATHPSFQGKQVQVVPVDPRITVQNCQQTLQFEQPFPNQPALRVRDLTLPRHAQLRYFPEAPAWQIRARWQALETPVAQAVDQKGGSTTTVQLTHTATFTHDGHTITLLATHWKAGKPMFVIRDATSGRETYPASRFLIGEDMTDSEITLDFNRAFTPPCGFTDFAICPLPPRENILPFRVEAGELY